jgi:hypothetical protein
MQGYGVTVFQGTERERFTFVVRSVVPDFRGWPNVIVVRLTGCPNCSEGGQHMFEHNQIYGGMSGSPLCVVQPETGECLDIGSIAMAKDFATTAKVLVTPIEYQFGLVENQPPAESRRTIAERGDYSSTCLVYGDRDWCFKGTLSARRDGRLFSMGHAVSVSDETMLTYGLRSSPARDWNPSARPSCTVSSASRSTRVRYLGPCPCS